MAILLKRIQRIAATVVLTSSMSCFAQTFTCDPHPPAGCDHLISLGAHYDVHISTDINSVILSDDATDWQGVSACNCSLIDEPSDPPWTEDCPTPEYSLAGMLGHAWNIEVSLSSEAHVALANVLLGSVGIDASLTTPLDTHIPTAGNKPGPFRCRVSTAGKGSAASVGSRRE